MKDVTSNRIILKLPLIENEVFLAYCYEHKGSTDLR